MKIDTHLHTIYSRDSAIKPQDLVDAAIAKGLDGVVVTEHWSYKASKPLEKLKLPEGFVLLRGMEYHTDSGHLLIYGIADDIFDGEYLPIHQVIDAVNARGGVAVPSHPYKVGYTHQLCDKVFELRGKIPAIETVNGCMPVKVNDMAETARMKLGVGGMGGSDAHFIEEVGCAYTEFESEIRTMADLLREIRQGNYIAKYNVCNRNVRKFK